MPTVPVLDAKGKAQQQLELSADVFGGPVRVPLLHQAVVRGAGRRGAPAPTTPRGAARSRAAAGSRGSRRAPAAPGRARSARPSGRAAASPSAPRRASTTSRCPPRCAAPALREALAAKIAAGEVVGGGPPRASTEAKTKALTTPAQGARASPRAPTLLVVVGAHATRWTAPRATCRGCRWRRPMHASVYQVLRNDRVRLRAGGAAVAAGGARS